MLNINEYKVFTQIKEIKIARLWILVLILISIGLIFINKNFKYYDYYVNQGEYQEDSVIMYVLIDDLSSITKNNRIVIDKDIYTYRVSEISSENTYLNNNYYKEVKISVNDYKGTDNDVIDIKIVKDEETLFSYVFKTIWR